MRAVSEGRAPLDAAFTAAMDACIQCRGCEAACPSGVQFGHLMEDTRTALEPRRSAPRRMVEAVAFRGVLPHRRVLGAATRALAVGQRLRLVPRRLGLPRLPLRPPAPLTRRHRSRRVPLHRLRDGRVAARRPPRRVPRDAGHRARASVCPGPGGDCCGALHTHAGRRADAVRLARRVMDAFPGDAPIVVDSAGCGAALADYGHLLDTDAARSVRGARRRRLDLARDAVRCPSSSAGTRRSWCRTRATCATCSTRTCRSRPCSVAPTTCGSPPTTACAAAPAAPTRRSSRELSEAVRARKVDALRAAAAGRPFVVASANPGCALHLAAAGLTVRHPVELLEDCLGPD